MRSRTLLMLIAVATAAGLRAHGEAVPRRSPFSFLNPSIRVSDDERRQLDKRDVLVRVLPAKDHEMALFAAGALSIGPERFISTVKDVVHLKKSDMVPQVGRFSAEPRLEDLEQLTLEQADLDELRRCKPDDCGLKLQGGEITALQQAMASGGGNGPAANAAVDRQFRRILFERLRQYQHNGDALTRQQVSTLVDHSPYVREGAPELARYFQEYPAAPLPGAESFFYWSKELYAWKPMIGITHVTIVRGTDGDDPEVLVAARDVFASRYTSGGLVLTMLFKAPDGPERYLVYINRTWVDGMRGLWRPFVELKVRGQARKLFNAARDRIESATTAVAN